MYTREDIMRQLEDLRVPSGSTVLMHISLRSVGKLEGRAEMLLDCLIEYLSSRDSLLCIPTHTWDNLYTDEPTLDLTNPSSCLGAFPNVALRDKRGIRSHNPTHSMVVFGDSYRALELIDGELDVKTPTSPESAYGKLLDRNGVILLVGVSQNSNTYLHSVEEMLDLPNRMLNETTTVSVKFESGEVVFRDVCLFDESVHGDVSHKFYMYEPAFRSFGAIHDSRLGDAPVQVCDCALMKSAIEHLASVCPSRDPLLFDGEIPENLFAV